jgi:beta-glucosidase
VRALQRLIVRNRNVTVGAMTTKRRVELGCGQRTEPRGPLYTRRKPLRTLTVVTTIIGAIALGVVSPGVSSAHTLGRVTKATCAKLPWTKASVQRTSTPSALAGMVLACLELRDPKTYRYDEIGIVSLIALGWFENVSEFGDGSKTQTVLAALGMPPLTLEDGPGGLLNPGATQLPNELALGATFDRSLATIYGGVLGAQAHAIGYDGVQAPDLNLTRVETWGRARESFGESPVLAGDMGAAEALAIASQGEIPVLKHFGPYSQDTDRKSLDQKVSDKALWSLYVRPFTIALRALKPELGEGGHALGVMCSYGLINHVNACLTPYLSQELDQLGVDAFVRTDLGVGVNPAPLLLNDVSLIKPMFVHVLVSTIGQRGVRAALNRAVLKVFETEFADGLVNGKSVTAVAHSLPPTLAASGLTSAISIEQRAAVLLKNSGVLPLDSADSTVSVISDATLPTTCSALASGLASALSVSSTCTDDQPASMPTSTLFDDLPNAAHQESRTVRFTPPTTGPYVVTATTLGNTKLTLNGKTIVNAQGLAEFEVPNTDLVQLTGGDQVSFEVTWTGTPPTVKIAYVQAAVDNAVSATSGAKVAIVVAYDSDEEGMDRSSIALPGDQDAVIAAVAAKVSTIVVLATDGAVSMPWLPAVDGVVEVWNANPATLDMDVTESSFVPAWTNLLDGQANPSGRLPETFPVSLAQSPAGVRAFWPGFGPEVNLDAAPDDGVGIGMSWYRAEGWPVLFPFGFGLSYTDYELDGGSVQSSSQGLTMTVAVKDTGQLGGTEPVQVYADWPAVDGEPDLQLVGFSTVTFTAAQAQGNATLDVTIPLSGDALSVYASGSMKLESGSYCLEAATYDGDPSAWSTGSIPLAPNPAGTQLTTTATTTLVHATCAS